MNRFLFSLLVLLLATLIKASADANLGEPYKSPDTKVVLHLSQLNDQTFFEELFCDTLLLD
jgi:hypothetical protein